MTGRLKTQACGCFIVEIAGSNSAGDVDVDLFCFVLSVSGLYDRLFTCSDHKKSFIRFAKVTFLINPLKTKCRQLYLKTQIVPRCKHFSSRL